MPKWIRDSGGRLVKCDTPQKGEFEVILNIMEDAPGLALAEELARRLGRERFT